MRKSLLLACLIFSSYGLLAQKTWTPDMIGVKLQAFNQDYSNLSYESLLGLVKNPQELQYNMDGMTFGYGTGMSGGAIGLNLRFEKNRLGTAKHELELGASVIIDSEVLANYSTEDYSRSIGWCLVQNRVDLSAAYNIVKSGKVVDLRFGPSVTLGTSFGDQMILMGDGGDQTASAESVQFLMGNVNFEISKTILKRVDIGLGGQVGMGFQPTKSNRLTGAAFHLGLSYHLKKSE